jgi:hypothetical protein
VARGAHEKLGRIADQEDLEGCVPPARPEPGAELLGEVLALGEPHPIGARELEDCLGMRGPRGRGHAEQNDA